MRVICKKDDNGLYYNFIKGKVYYYTEDYLSIRDEYGNDFFYTSQRFKEFFYSENEMRKMKLKKIYASSL